MPNWCTNTTQIFGEAEDIQKFADAVTISTELGDTEEGWDEAQPEIAVMRKLVPIPEGKDGYDWALHEWGSKWGDCHARVRDDYDPTMPPDNLLVLDYDTAWGPCDKGWRNVSKLFPNLTFVTQYNEPGMGFCGAVGNRAGEVIHDVGYDQHSDEYPEWPGSDDDDKVYTDWCEKVDDLIDLCVGQVSEAMMTTGAARYMR